MYLKRLDVAGFKSFAVRTSFEFNDGITAIVGPNGVGKSNIADALRWVLGEQSGRLLRARKLEDVIFAGSSQRSPAEKAEVTLTLDNSDGWLPIDFAEVAISRRAYRSGESDYLINRKRVRLRDLQDLLLRANASQNSYAIIGQGLVESVLSLRPDERRQLIEEAADIQRYRLKIEEAQSKLAATRENMERVKLLVKELSPRLAALERQAKRAAEHFRLSRELGQALQVWYEHHWQQALEALAVARAGHDQAQAEETQARLAVDTCQRELNSIGEELDQRRGALAASAGERQRLTARAQELEQAVAIARQRQSILEARRQELEAELIAVEQERAKAAEAAQVSQGRQAALEDELVAARQALEGKTRELAELEQEFRGMQDKGASAQERSSSLRAAASDLKARVQRLAYSQGDLAKDISRLDTRRRALINQMAELIRVLRGQRTQEAEAAAAVIETAGRRQALEAEATTLKASLAHLEAKQQARRGKLEALQARLAVLREAQEQYRQAAVQEPEPEVDVEGFVAAVHQILRVPRGLETAIESALADYVEAIIVNHQREAIAAAQAIAQQGLNRTYVLPLDSVKIISALNILKERGILGVAARLVKCDPRFQRLVDALLGRTIVVQDVETAARVVRRGMGTVVSLDGVVFHPLGSISAGFPKISRPHILGHERDLEAIPKEMDRLRRSLELSQRQVDSLGARLQEIEANLSSLSQEVDAAQQKRLGVQDALGQRQQRLAQLRGELRGLIAAQDRIREQELSFRREAERLQAEREGLLAEAKQAQDMAQYLRRAGRLVNQRRDALLRAVTEASARVARLEGESQSGLREASAAALARLDNQIAAKQMQLRGLELELSSIAASADNDEEELSKARQRLDAYSETYEPEQAAIAQLESRQREFHSQLLTNQGRLLQAERSLLEAEAEVRRWETELASLRQRIEDDGLTITDQGDIASPHVIAAPIPPWLAAEAEGQQGGIQPISGGANIDPQVLGPQIDRLRGQIRQLGPVNVEAQADYQQLKERHDFLSSQLGDLQEAKQSLLRAIDELTGVMRQRFQTTFAQVAEGFSRYFQAFFGGGHARLVLRQGSGQALTDPRERSPDRVGVDIVAQPPGRRLQTLAQLSGGEKALTAVALLFALLQAKPSPFCVLDEVDAMLDDANVGRFVAALRELAQRTQFIVVTHNRKTIEVSDAIYGLSLGPDSASRVLSLRLADMAAG